MSAKPLLLDGVIGAKKTGGDDEEVRKLRSEKLRNDEELRKARRDLEDAQLENAKLRACISGLRQEFSPFYHFLRAVFGDIELAIGEEGQAPSVQHAPGQAAAPTAATDPRWQSFKDTFPGVPSRIIDALLAHREMTASQLQGLLGGHSDTINKALMKLTKAGAVTKEGGRGGKIRLNA